MKSRVTLKQIAELAGVSIGTVDRALNDRGRISTDTKAKILKAAGKYCKDDNVAYKIIKNTKKYNFYFEEGTVYICYGSYELNHGPDFDIFTVKGKYK